MILKYHCNPPFNVTYWEQKGSKVLKWVKIFKTERTLEMQQARLTEACGKV